MTVDNQGTPENTTPETTPAPKKTTPRRAPRAKKAAAPQETALSVQSPKGTLRLPNNRPIEASHLQVVSTFSSVSAPRPVVATGFEISGTLTVSGQRPIAASHLQVSDSIVIMGNRPVASNEIDDAATLMGYLD